MSNRFVLVRSPKEGRPINPSIPCMEIPCMEDDDLSATSLCYHITSTGKSWSNSPTTLKIVEDIRKELVEFYGDSFDYIIAKIYQRGE